MTAALPPPITNLNQQVSQLYQQGRYRQALPLATQACDLARGLSGENHPDLAHSLNNLADLHRELGYYTQAEQPYLHALKIKSAALGKEHPDYARSLNDLGRLYEM